MTGVNSGIVKERKRGDNRVASVSAGQNLVGRLGRALDDGDLPMEKNNIWDARTAVSLTNRSRLRRWQMTGEAAEGSGRPVELEKHSTLGD